MLTETVMMPRELTAEDGAKAILSGEFKERVEVDCPECFGDGCDDCGGEGYYTLQVTVKWPTIKAIYAKAVEHLAT